VSVTRRCRDQLGTQGILIGPHQAATGIPLEPPSPVSCIHLLDHAALTPMAAWADIGVWSLSPRGCM